MDALTKELEDFELKKAAARAVTGVLASHPNSTDVHIINLSLTFHGQELLSDTKLELNSGRRYGLIGLNGIGKRWWRLGRGDSVLPRSWAERVVNAADWRLLDRRGSSRSPISSPRKRNC